MALHRERLECPPIQPPSGRQIPSFRRTKQRLHIVPNTLTQKPGCGSFPLGHFKPAACQTVQAFTARKKSRHAPIRARHALLECWPYAHRNAHYQAHGPAQATVAVVGTTCTRNNASGFIRRSPKQAQRHWPGQACCGLAVSIDTHAQQQASKRRPAQHGRCRRTRPVRPTWPSGHAIAAAGPIASDSIEKEAKMKMAKQLHAVRQTWRALSA